MSDLYCLSEKLQDMAMKNSALKAIVTSCKQRREDGQFHFPELSPVQKVYKGTLQGSMARKFLAGLYAYTGDGTWISRQSDTDWPPAFLYDVSINALEKKVKKGVDPLIG
jgi:hypothetical protein